MLWLGLRGLANQRGSIRDAGESSPKVEIQNQGWGLQIKGQGQTGSGCCLTPSHEESGRCEAVSCCGAEERCLRAKLWGPQAGSGDLKWGGAVTSPPWLVCGCREARAFSLAFHGNSAKWLRQEP